MQVSNNVIVLPSVDGCQCKGSCTNEKTCSCASLNGSEFPYVRRNGGRCDILLLVLILILFNVMLMCMSLVKSSYRPTLSMAL